MLPRWLGPDMKISASANASTAAASRPANTIFDGAASARMVRTVTGCHPAAANERRGGEQRRVERDAVVGETLGERRANAGALEMPEELAVLVDAHAEVERVDVLEDDDVALHAHDLAHLGDATRAVAQPGEVHDEVERRRHLLPDDAHRQVHAGHERHGLDTGERVAR